MEAPAGGYFFGGKKYACSIPRGRLFCGTAPFLGAGDAQSQSARADGASQKSARASKIPTGRFFLEEIRPTAIFVQGSGLFLLPEQRQIAGAFRPQKSLRA
jgi:hypothetical protein